jgi:cytidine deaminase
MTAAEVREKLCRQAEPFLARAHVPYSGNPAVAALLLPGGTIVPGVRVESASFSLTIPAALNAITTAVAAGHTTFSALATLGPVPLTTTGLLEGFGLHESGIAGLWVSGSPLAEPSSVLDPALGDTISDAASSVALARKISGRAHIPESSFPVGAVLCARDGKTLPGVNVEHPDWTCILCAERNVLGTAVTFGALPAVSLGLSCPTEPGASPCGACRQLIAELAPNALIWMDRDHRPPAASSPEALLPLAFFGKSLGR